MDSQPTRGKRLLLSAVILVGTGALWFALSGWTIRESERFYEVVPPLAVALAAVWLWPDRGRLRKMAFATFRGGLIAGFLCFAYLFGMGYMMTRGKAQSPVRGWEVLCDAYFLVAVGMLFLASARAIEVSLHAAARRWCAAKPQTRAAKAWKFTVAKLAPRVLVMALFFVWLLGSLNVHRPKLGLITDPKQMLNLEYEDVSFVTDDNHTIRGWFIPAKDPQCERTVIICHGLGANRSPFLVLARLAHQCDAHALMFDFRGHGESDGHTVSFGWHERADVLAAIAYMRQNRPQQCRELYGMGVSMGTSALVRAAADVEPPLDGVILDSAFTCADDMAEQLVWVVPWPVRPAVVATGLPMASLEAGAPLANVRPVDQIDDIRCPVLVIHATGDKMIPVQQGRQMFEHAREPKQLLLVECPYHGGSIRVKPREYAAAVQKLLNVTSDAQAPASLANAAPQTAPAGDPSE